MLFPSLYAVQPFSEECKIWLDAHINGNRLRKTREGGVVVEHKFIERELIDIMEAGKFEEGEDFEIVPVEERNYVVVND